MVNEKEFTVISTFAGCGGSSLGYKWAGFKELLAIDFDKNAVETFRLNFNAPIWQRDIKDVTGKEILDFTGLKKRELDILDGSPPCQGFSTAGKMQVSDDRNQLFKEFKRLIIDLEPKIFVMENVTGMMKGRMKGMFNEILGELKSLDYNVKCKLMNAMWYEVPQSRERLIFIGVRRDLNLEPVYPNFKGKIITAKEAIESVISKTFKAIIKAEKELSLQIKPGENGLKYGHSFSCRKLHPNKPAYTMLKEHHSVFHYKEIRYISIEELLALSSFPVQFKMIGNYDYQFSRIGNAVPPKMMYHIARTLKEEILKKVNLNG